MPQERPPEGGLRVFARLLAFLRPYRRGVIASLLLAAAAMGTGVLIPYLVGRTVDDIRDGGGSLWPLAAAVAVWQGRSRATVAAHSANRNRSPAAAILVTV